MRSVPCATLGKEEVTMSLSHSNSDPSDETASDGDGHGTQAAEYDVIDGELIPRGELREWLDAMGR